MSERYKATYYHKTEYDRTLELTCHFKFEQATELQKFSPHLGGGKPICNGCGPVGYGAIVPDSILGVRVAIAGWIHNFSYQFGIDHEDKTIVDETFGDNMDRLIRADYEYYNGKEIDRHNARIEKGTNWFTRLYEKWKHKRKLDYLKEMYESRLFIAEEVYERAVRVFGKSSFWDKRKINFTLAEVHQNGGKL